MLYLCPCTTSSCADMHPYWGFDLPCKHIFYPFISNKMFASFDFHTGRTHFNSLLWCILAGQAKDWCSLAHQVCQKSRFHTHFLLSSRHHKILITGLAECKTTDDFSSKWMEHYASSKKGLWVFHNLAMKSAIIYGLGKTKDEIHWCFEWGHEAGWCARSGGQGEG